MRSKHLSANLALFDGFVTGRAGPESLSLENPGRRPVAKRHESSAREQVATEKASNWRNRERALARQRIYADLKRLGLPAKVGRIGRPATGCAPHGVPSRECKECRRKWGRDHYRRSHPGSKPMVRRWPCQVHGMSEFLLDAGKWKYCALCQRERSRVLRLSRREVYNARQRERYRRWRLKNPKVAKDLTVYQCRMHGRVPVRMCGRVRCCWDCEIRRRRVRYERKRADAEWCASEAARLRELALRHLSPVERLARLLRKTPSYRLISEQRRHEKELAHRRRRSARKRGARAWGFSAVEWRLVREIYGHRCAYCGRDSGRLTQDHVVPLARGGDHTFFNIVPACFRCNVQKGLRPWRPHPPGDIERVLSA